MDTQINLPIGVALAVVATILLLCGLGAQLTIGGYGIAIPEGWPRILAAGLGIFFLAALLFLAVVGHFFTRHNKSTDQAADRPKASRTSAGRFFTTVVDRTTPFDQMVKDASAVHISGITTVNLLAAYERTFEELIRNGCNLKIMFLDPRSESAKIVYGGNHQRYHDNIQSSLNVLRHLKSRAPNLVSVKAMTHAPTVSMVFVQKRNRKATEQNFVQVQLYFLRGAIGNDRPIFRVYMNDKWYEVFRKEFDDVWNNLAAEYQFETVV